MTKFIKLHSGGFKYSLNIDNISHFCRYTGERTTICLKQSGTYQNENGHLVSELLTIYSDETPEEIMKLIERE